MDSTEERLARLAGWQLGENGKWWNPSNDDGSRYVNNERAFRYICEDHLTQDTEAAPCGSK